MPDWSRPVMHENGQPVRVLEIYPDDHPHYPGLVAIERIGEPVAEAAIWWVPRDGRVKLPGLSIVNMPD